MLIESDIIIIGAGPIGLFAIFQAGMLKMSCSVIDNLEFIGGQCTALYPQKPIYDIPAYPKILAQDLIANLEEQAKPFNPQYFLSQQAEKLEKKDGYFYITTSKNNVLKAKAVVIAAGSGSFGPNRPPIDNLELYENKSIFYSVYNPAQFKDKNIVIAGGGDSAVDWALNLNGIARSIKIVHRRDKFKALPESVSQLHELISQGKIELITPYQLHSLDGENGILQTVNVSDLSGNIRKLEADILLPFFGLSMNLGPLTEWNLQLNKHHIEVDPVNMLTNIPGIFAIGDIATYQGKLKLILTGFAEAASAMHNVYHIVHPDQALHFEYSTSKGVNI